MKRFILTGVILLASTSLFAQEVKVVSEDSKHLTTVQEEVTPDGRSVTTIDYERNIVETKSFWSDWHLSAGVGAQVYIGDTDERMKFGDRIAPAIDIDLSKWISPSFGLGIGVSGLKMKGVFETNGIYGQKANFPKREWQYGEGLTWQHGYFIDAFLYAMLDLDNIFAGYNPNRFWNIAIYGGGGVITGFGPDYNYHEVSWNLGLNNRFRIAPHFDLILNIRGAFIGDYFDGEGGGLTGKWDGLAGATFGISYRFGKKEKEWKEVSRTTHQYFDNSAVNEQKREYEESTKALAAAQKEGKMLEEEQKSIEKTESNSVFMTEVPKVWFHINFKIDRTDLNQREQINLKSISEFMKSTPDTQYMICGFADKQTSNPKHNQWLSEQRSKRVFDYLTKEQGVDPKQLVVDSKGGVDYMFYNQEEHSRCVMITTIEK